MLNDIASQVSFFGLFLTAGVFFLAVLLQKKTKLTLLNPLLTSCIVIILFLLITGIDYNVYQYGKIKADGSYDGTGAVFFQNMLTPTTVCLAIPLYEKIKYLKKYPVAIFGGIFIGSFTCLVCILAMSYLFGLDHTQYITLLPKSITTAIGMGFSAELGGMPAVTVAAIILTGLCGNIVASAVFKLFRIHHPVAQGLACGTSAHAIGTSKARELGDVQEAMSGLSIAVAGIMTVILASFFAMIQF